MIYKAKDNERLDSIVYAYYGSLMPFEKILEANLKANPDFSVILKAGDDVALPDIKIAPPVEEAKALWD
jgi:phage tail protein X